VFTKVVDATAVKRAGTIERELAAAVELFSLAITLTV
jgi:hypothetical protein